MSNFAFIEIGRAPPLESASKAEASIHSHPRACAFSASKMPIGDFRPGD